MLEGVKWCGKTTTAKQQANSIVSMKNQDTASSDIELAKHSEIQIYAP